MLQTQQLNTNTTIVAFKCNKTIRQKYQKNINDYVHSWILRTVPVSQWNLYLRAGLILT